jgi:hypothetical protein
MQQPHRHISYKLIKAKPLVPPVHGRVRLPPCLLPPRPDHAPLGPGGRPSSWLGAVGARTGEAGEPAAPPTPDAWGARAGRRPTFCVPTSGGPCACSTDRGREVGR